MRSASSRGSADERDANAKPGGEVIVTYKDDVSTLDPAIGYDWQNWSMIKSLFDGLMDYEPGTSTLKPDLAESYEITDNGATFTFKLRSGVKFHNGREMTADDVKYTLDRVTNPKTQSPGAGFFASIKGYDDVAGGKAETLSGVTVVDPTTVKIELSRPDATFLHVMALNFSHVVPKEEVEKSGADFGKSPVGTGAFKLAEWTLGQRLVFEKNADYWNKWLPYLDKITFESAGADRGSSQVAEGGGGYPGRRHSACEIPGSDGGRRAEGAGRRRWPAPHRLHHHEHDHGAVRQRQGSTGSQHGDQQGADRPADQQPRRAGQSAAAAFDAGLCQGLQGLRLRCRGAKKLLAEAGHPDGFETELYAMNTDPNPRIAQAIQQDLAAIGIKANIQSLAQANVIAAGGEKDGAPMIWSGGMGWIADFPDPSNFYGPILGCGGAVAGGWNWSWYCNEDLDKLAAEADSITDPARLRSGTRSGVRSTKRSWPMPHGCRSSTSSASPCVRPGWPEPTRSTSIPSTIPINYDYVYVNDVQ